MLEKQELGKFLQFTTCGDPYVTGSDTESKLHNYNHHGVVCKEMEDDKGIVHKDIQWLDAGV
jgi:GTP-dependent phosphoenolpyruvate carboxykinase